MEDTGFMPPTLTKDLPGLVHFRPAGNVVHALGERPVAKMLSVGENPASNIPNPISRVERDQDNPPVYCAGPARRGHYLGNAHLQQGGGTFEGFYVVGLHGTFDCSY